MTSVAQYASSTEGRISQLGDLGQRRHLCSGVMDGAPVANDLNVFGMKVRHLVAVTYTPYTTGLTTGLSNRFDNRLYRVNGALKCRKN